MGRVPQSSIIVVGNEILRGFTVDTNSNWLAGRLFRCGYPVQMITTIGDVPAGTGMGSLPMRDIALPLFPGYQT